MIEAVFDFFPRRSWAVNVASGATRSPSSSSWRISSRVSMRTATPGNDTPRQATGSASAGGVPRDDAEAVARYKLAASGGDARAIPPRPHVRAGRSGLPKGEAEAGGRL